MMRYHDMVNPAGGGGGEREFPPNFMFAPRAPHAQDTPLHHTRGDHNRGSRNRGSVTASLRDAAPHTARDDAPTLFLSLTQQEG